MTNKRENSRHSTLARARIPSVFDGEALLKDLSITGCCIEYNTSLDVKSNTEYSMEIIPEKAAQIESFKLLVASRWIKSGTFSCEIGFSIVSPPKGKLFQRYVDYISWRSA